MLFIKDFLRNLALLIIISLLLLILFPGIMVQIFQLYGAIFGPLAIIIVLFSALPRKRRHI
jgi:hypothetical protein